MNLNSSDGTARARRAWALGFRAGLVLLVLQALSHAGQQAPKGQAQDMSGILGPGSQLMAADDGKFEIVFDDDNQLGEFHATKDVVLLTKEIQMRCEELIYSRASGTIDAVAKPGELVHIKMLGGGGSKGQKGKQDVNATCQHYKMLIKEKRHILTGRGKGKPEVQQTNEKGEVTAFSGTTITMSQRPSGAWRIEVKGEPEIYNPKEKYKLQQARRTLGATAPAGPPHKPPTVKPTPSRPVPKTARKAPAIETGAKRERKPAPRRVVKIDEGS